MIAITKQFVSCLKDVQWIGTPKFMLASQFLFLQLETCHSPAPVSPIGFVICETMRFGTSAFPAQHQPTAGPSNARATGRPQSFTEGLPGVKARKEMLMDQSLKPLICLLLDIGDLAHVVCAIID